MFTTSVQLQEKGLVLDKTEFMATRDRDHDVDIVTLIHISSDIEISSCEDA